MYIVVISTPKQAKDIERYVLDDVAKHFLPKYDEVEWVDSFWLMEVYPAFQVNSLRIKGYPDDRVLLCLLGMEFKHLDNIFTLKKIIRELDVPKVSFTKENFPNTAVSVVAKYLAPFNNGKFYIPKLISVPQENVISTCWLYHDWNGKPYRRLPFAKQ